MKIELFQTDGCQSCADARESLRAQAQQVVPGVEWRDVDVVAEFDYAVELGVMALPALAVDGELAFTTLPTPAQLAGELKRRLRGTDRGR